MKCPKCGTTVDEDNAFCKVCGEPLSEAGRPRWPQTVDEWLVVSGGILTLLGSLFLPWNRTFGQPTPAIGLMLELYRQEWRWLMSEERSATLALSLSFMFLCAGISIWSIWKSTIEDEKTVDIYKRLLVFSILCAITPAYFLFEGIDLAGPIATLTGCILLSILSIRYLREDT